jgi:hypothetical protein
VAEAAVALAGVAAVVGGLGVAVVVAVDSETAAAVEAVDEADSEIVAVEEVVAAPLTGEASVTSLARK